MVANEGGFHEKWSIYFKRAVDARNLKNIQEIMRTKQPRLGRPVFVEHPHSAVHVAAAENDVDRARTPPVVKVV